MEFGDGGVAAAQHLDVQVMRDHLRLIGRQALDEAVHELAPRPEVVVGRAAHLREPGQRALEGMRVQVRHPGQHRTGKRLQAARPALDRDEVAVLDRKQHVLRPAVGKKRIASEVLFHAAMITTCTMPPG